MKDQHIGAAAGAIEALRLASLKAQLKQSFGEVHKEAGVAPEMIRGYGGKKVDRYDTAITEEEFAKPGGFLFSRAWTNAETEGPSPFLLQSQTGKENADKSVQRMFAAEEREDRRAAEAKALDLADQAEVIAEFQSPAEGMERQVPFPAQQVDLAEMEIVDGIFGSESDRFFAEHDPPQEIPGIRGQGETESGERGGRRLGRKGVAEKKRRIQCVHLGDVIGIRHSIPPREMWQTLRLFRARM